MNSLSQVERKTFTVDVEFSSGGAPYATETYTIEATDWYRAQREALEMSLSSVYDNARIRGVSSNADPGWAPSRASRALPKSYKEALRFSTPTADLRANNSRVQPTLYRVGNL